VETISILSQIPVEIDDHLLWEKRDRTLEKVQGIDETPIVPYHEQKSIRYRKYF